MAAQIKSDINRQRNNNQTIPDTNFSDSDDPNDTTRAPLTSNGRSKTKQVLAPTPTKKVRRTKFTLIVKPDCFSQGKGIFLTNNFNELKGLPKEEGDHVI